MIGERLVSVTALVVVVAVAVGLTWLLRTRRLTEGPDDGAELLDAVTGLGPIRELPASAHLVAMELEADEEMDLRGVRDVEPEAPNPWRAP